MRRFNFKICIIFNKDLFNKETLFFLSPQEYNSDYEDVDEGSGDYSYYEGSGNEWGAYRSDDEDYYDEYSYEGSGSGHEESPPPWVNWTPKPTEEPTTVTPQPPFRPTTMEPPTEKDQPCGMFGCPGGSGSKGISYNWHLVLLSLVSALLLCHH